MIASTQLMDVNMQHLPLNLTLLNASLVDSGSIDMPADEHPPFLFRRVVSSLVITGYLMMTMGQSYASSVVPFNGDVELGRTKFAQSIVDADEKVDDEATDSTGHSPGSTPEKVHPEPLSGGEVDVKDDHQHPFSNKIAPAPKDMVSPEEEETLKADIVTYIKEKHHLSRYGINGWWACPGGDVYLFLWGGRGKKGVVSRNS